MNARERFIALMHYQAVDRCPIMDFGFWAETLPLWEGQGYPKGANPDQFFGMDPQWAGCGGNTHLCPSFPHLVLEDKGDSEIVQNGDGVIVERGKHLGSIPRHLAHKLTDRASWQAHFKPRLVPGDPARFGDPAEWQRRLAKWADPKRDYPLFIGAGSLYGIPRNWFGLERISEIIYDDPELFDEIVETLAQIIIANITKTCEAGVRPEAASMWEDMCYNSGPLLSPRQFEQFLVPRLKRITQVLRNFGVDLVIVDCDGKIDALAPLWLKAGVNIMFPIEVGTWGHDPVKFRQQYGKEMRLMGGFDKHLLAKSKAVIAAEVRRLAPLVAEGGFIPFCDHRVPPDVPLANYLFYLEEAKRVWGKGLPDIKPTGKPLPVPLVPA